MAKKTKTREEEAEQSQKVQRCVMPDPDGVNVDKRAFVRKQVEQMMDKGRPFVRCGCLRKLQMYEAYTCLYCGESYCATCAEIHFGKTRAEYQKEKQA